METRRLSAFAISLTLHSLALLAAIVSTKPPSAASPTPRPRSISAFAAPRDDDSGPPGLKPIDPLDALTLRATPGSHEVVLPTFSMNIAKITDRASVLFPFVTPGLALHRFAIVSQEEMRDTFIDPVPQPAQTHAAAHPQPPLALSDAALQAVIDRSWSRRDRWTPFQEIATLANDHNPDAGKLPALLHAYERQNGLQPYVDTSIRDPRLWAELGLAADHVEFIRFISEFASAHPGTKSTTELLFLLDQLAQANMDALMTLLDTDPPASLEWTRETNKDAYDLVVMLRAHYARQLTRKGLASPDAIAAHYARTRLAILDGILRTTPNGYRASDARFLIGSIHWREGDTGDALRAWRAMTPEPGDAYATSGRRILDAITAETGGDRASADARETMRRLAGQINAILRGEHGRWVMFSLDRLRRFGFHFDTF